MFRIIKECRPTWVVGENVAGFVNMELDRTVSDLEGEGYEVRVFVLGAVSVQAPHQRQRCWIIGRKRDVADSKRKCRRTGEKPQQSARGTARESTRNGSKDVADSDSSRFEQGNEEMAGGSPEQPDCRRVQPGENVSNRNGTGLQGGVQDRESYPEGRQESNDGCTPECGTGRQGNRNGQGSTQCGMGDLADGLSAELLDIGRTWEVEPDIPRVAVGEKNRTKKLKALGNSVVPQIPEILGRLIMEVEKNEGSR